MLSIRISSQFKRDSKMAKKRGKDMVRLKTVIDSPANEQPLSAMYRDHALQGNYVDCRECHIEPDWLLVYRLADDELQLVRTGSHSDLFR